MSPIRITREVHQGWLSGNGIACKCRVELATKISPGFPTIRTVDIWIPEKPPEGTTRCRSTIRRWTWNSSAERGLKL